MTKRVKLLVPILGLPFSSLELPQCVDSRKTTYANDKADTDFQCKRRAKLTIDGKPYCLRHGEIQALKMLMAADSEQDKPGSVSHEGRVGPAQENSQ